MFRRYQYVIVIVCCLGALASCNQNPAPQTAPVVATPKAELMAPFRYHKLIESSPGKYFDVFGWGRGKDSSGAYMILHSDSTGKQYSNTSGDLEGSIIDVYNTDMNMDGNPEILLVAKAKDTTNHVNIYAYEFRGAKSNKLNFPKLTDKTKKTYRGDDAFYIKDGILVREFPVYDGSGASAKPTGYKKILQYGLRDGEFSVKDISPVDTTSVKTAVKDSVKKTSAKAEKVSEKPKKKEKEKKRHKEEVHHKKKRHHRRD